MGDYVGTVQEQHCFDEVVNERRDEHGLQLDIRVLEDVGEGALCAVVRQEHDAVGFDARADETESNSSSVAAGTHPTKRQRRARWSTC